MTVQGYIDGQWDGWNSDTPSQQCNAFVLAGWSCITKNTQGTPPSTLLMVIELLCVQRVI